MYETLHYFQCNIYYIYAGGMFGLYDGKFDVEITSNPDCNRVKHLKDLMPETWSEQC